MKRKVFPIVMGSISAVLIAITIVGNVLTFGIFDGILTSYFGITGASVQNFEKNQYYARDLNSKEDAGLKANELSERIEAEGAVLLKNNNDVLPLNSKSKISVFSQSSNNIIINSTGGSGTTSGAAVTLNSALSDVGLSVNQKLVEFYKSTSGTYVRKSGGLAQGLSKDPYVWSIGEVPLSAYTQDVKNSYTSYKDAAIVVFSREGCENGDLPQDMSAADGRTRGTAHILELDKNEKDLLQHVTTNFEKVIVLLNTSNTLECGFLDDYDIDACLWIGGVGQYGLNAVADILVGNVNPSGRLADTMAYDVLSSPAMQNFGNFEFTLNGSITDHHYVTYAEGIYVGYKYYETRYEDKVLNRANVGDYNYDTTVQFPFGYGQSYTTFEWDNFQYSLDETKENITVTVDVTNTGNKSGKDVVEFYYQSPYTNYDIEKGIEKASVSLADFAKTQELAPGEVETVSVTFPVERMKSYDAKGHKTYILEESDKYYIAAGRNAHDALNNILSKKTDDTTLGDALLVHQESFEERIYANDTTSNNPVTNQFDEANGNKTYLTRNNWVMMEKDGLRDGTNPSNRYDNDGYIYQFAVDNAFIKNLETMGYAASKSPETNFSEPTFGANNGKKLIDMRGKAFDDPEWDALLDQIREKEMISIVTLSGYKTYAIESIGKPYATDSDGPSSWRSFIGDGINAGGVPNETVQASTWNKELVKEFGTIMGELALWAKIEAKDSSPNLTGWYAPAMNIHRTPFGGRNFEYYSEDGMLSGLIGSSVVRGATDKGLITYIKHFAFNEQETNRMTNNVTWAQEQALREVYLTPFEMSIKDGGSRGIMTSYNRIGTVWAGGSYNLLTNVLRKEWGFNGFAITDYMDGEWEDIDQMIAAGGDAALYPNSDKNVTTDGARFKTYLRRVAHHLCYAFVNSNGMNGIDSSSVISGGTPIYYRYMTAIDIVLGTSIALTLGLLLFRIIKEMMLKKKYPEEEIDDSILDKELKLPLIPKIIIGALVGVITLSTGLWLILTNPKDVSGGKINNYIAEIDENEDLKAKYGTVLARTLPSGTKYEDEKYVMSFDAKAVGYVYEAEYAELTERVVVSSLEGTSEGKFVEYFTPGESMTYTINSSVETDVMVVMSIATTQTTSAPIGDIVYGAYGKERLNNDILYGDRTFTGTGSYTSFKEHVIGQIHLFEGENKIKFSAYKSEFGDINYDYIALVNPGQHEAINKSAELAEKFGYPTKDKLSISSSMNFDSNARGYIYEAESTLVGKSSKIKVENNASASGGQNVGYYDPGEKLTFTISSLVETDALLMFAGATANKKKALASDTVMVSSGYENDNLTKLEENGLYVSTPGGWANFKLGYLGEIHLKRGNNIIELVSRCGINVDYIALSNVYTGTPEDPLEDPVDIEEKYGDVSKAFLRAESSFLDTSSRGAYYEAEKAILNGANIKVENNESASGGQNVGYTETNNTLTFNINADKQTDALIGFSASRYPGGSFLLSDVLTVKVNDSIVKSYDRMFVASAYWNVYNEYSVGETLLREGNNKIEIIVKEVVNYDYLTIALPYSATEPNLTNKYGQFTKADLMFGTNTFDSNERGYYYEATNATLTGQAKVSNEFGDDHLFIGSFETGSTMTFEITSSEDITAVLMFSAASNRAAARLSKYVAIHYGTDVNELYDNVYTADRALTTTDWSTFKEYVAGEIHLKKGKNYIRFTSVLSLNYDYIGLVNAL